MREGGSKVHSAFWQPSPASNRLSPAVPEIRYSVLLTSITLYASTTSPTLMSL